MTDIAPKNANRTAADTAPERADRSAILSVAVAAPVAGFMTILTGQVVTCHVEVLSRFHLAAGSCRAL